MMIKLMGSVLIIISTSLIGFLKSHRLLFRVRYLMNIKTALIVLESEIQFSANRLEQAFRNISSLSDTQNLFLVVLEHIDNCGIREAWRKASQVCGKKMCLNEADIEVLQSLSSELGMTDREHQLKNIKYVVTLLENQYTQAKQEYDNMARMYRNIGVLSGLFISILLF